MGVACVYWISEIQNFHQLFIISSSFFFFFFFFFFCCCFSDWSFWSPFSRRFPPASPPDHTISYDFLKAVC